MDAPRSPERRRRDRAHQALTKAAPIIQTAATAARYLVAMNFDIGDGIAAVAALFAGFAWLATARSARADTTTAAIEQETVQAQSVRWSIETVNKHELDVRASSTRRARLVNDGTERALGVRVSGGEVHPASELAEVVPGRAIEFDYKVGYKDGEEPPPEVFNFRVDWNRPEIAGGERKSANLTFDPAKIAKAP